MATRTKPRPRPYRLRKPCPNCPFRSDIDKYLRFERVQEIANSLYGGAEFPCHETTEHYDDPETGAMERIATERSAFCAGALITMEKEGHANQIMRVSERLGMYDPTRLDMEAPVYGSLGEWVASFTEIPTVTVTGPYGRVEVLEFEHCGVVGEDCEDPPGYMGSGGVMHSTEIPTCHPVDDCCCYCGNTACASCKSGDVDEDGNPICVFCKEDQDGD